MGLRVEMVVPVVLAVEVAIHLAQVLVAQEINHPLLLLKDSLVVLVVLAVAPMIDLLVVAELLKQELLLTAHLLLAMVATELQLQFLDPQQHTLEEAEVVVVM